MAINALFCNDYIIDHSLNDDPAADYGLSSLSGKRI